MGWEVKTNSTIYGIRCKENGKVYIGRTQNLNRRIQEHFYELQKGYKYNNQWQEDFKKYGVDGFEVYILKENVPPSECDRVESNFIRKYNSADPSCGYNKIPKNHRVKVDFVTGVMPNPAIKDERCKGAS